MTERPNGCPSWSEGVVGDCPDTANSEQSISIKENGKRN